MTTVQNLIDELNKVENKNRIVILQDVDGNAARWDGSVSLENDENDEIMLFVDHK